MSRDVTCNLGMTRGLLQNLRHGGGGNSASERGSSSDANSMREQVPKNLVLIKNPLGVGLPLPVTFVPTTASAVWGRWPERYSESGSHSTVCGKQSAWGFPLSEVASVLKKQLFVTLVKDGEADFIRGPF